LAISENKRWPLAKGQCRRHFLSGTNNRCDLGDFTTALYSLHRAPLKSMPVDFDASPNN
jgi:hypothetical protein